jgi:hypothetical protein
MREQRRGALRVKADLLPLGLAHRARRSTVQFVLQID